MRLARLFARRAGWLTALLVAALVLAPLAAETPAEAAAEQCVLAVGDHDDAGRDGTPHHRHHAHGCGTCHVHLLAPGAFSGFAKAVDVATFVSSSRPAVVTGPDIRLFRPPRA
jgi:hypothetical protein